MCKVKRLFHVLGVYYYSFNSHSIAHFALVNRLYKICDSKNNRFGRIIVPDDHLKVIFYVGFTIERGENTVGGIFIMH